MFHFNAGLAAAVGGLDKGSPNVVIADDPQLKTQPRFNSIAERGGNTRIRHRHHHIGIDMGFAGQLPADVLAHGVNVTAFDLAVGAGKVDVFKNAEP